MTLDDATQEIARKLIVRKKGPEVASQLSEQLLSKLKSKQDISALITHHKLEWKEVKDVSVAATYVPGLGSRSELVSALFSLKNVGDISDKVVRSGTSYYI